MEGGRERVTENNPSCMITQCALKKYDRLHGGRDRVTIKRINCFSTDEKLNHLTGR